MKRRWLALGVLVWWGTSCAAPLAPATLTPLPATARPQFIEFFAGT